MTNWTTKYIGSDIEADPAYEQFIEDYARALDESGWMIVPQRDRAQYGPWKMDSKFGPVPAWAKDINEKPSPPRPPLRVIDGDKQ
jgi:hypothetical protein